MSPPEPRIVWPAPGLPALLSHDETRVDLIVRYDGDLESMRRWAQSLRLLDPAGAADFALCVESAEPITAADAGDRVAGVQRLADVDRTAWARLRATIPTEAVPQPPATVGVFSLQRAGEILRRNAVARFSRGHTLRFAFASDIHVAAMWDEVFDGIARTTPDLEPAALHPGRQLRRFVEQANDLASRGLLDLVVFGGDLIDHIYPYGPASRSRSSPGSNVDLFLDLVAPLRVPMVTIPGNHDYRLYPWRARAYGLGSIGLNPSQNRRLLQAMGWWGRWPLTWSDFDALRTVHSDEPGHLAHHLTHLAPSGDFCLTARGVRLVFADTGRDSIVDWQRIEAERRWLFLRSLASAWEDPDSEGLHDEQIRTLSRSMEGTTATAVFLHAPLLHPRGDDRPGAIDLHPGESDGTAADIAFELRLQRTGQRGGVVFRNPAAILRALAGARGPVSVFTGHVHKATGVLMDRRSWQATIGPPAAPEDGSATLPIFTAPSLSHWRCPGGEAPGYLLATLEDGRLAQLERRLLFAPS